MANYRTYRSRQSKRRSGGRENNMVDIASASGREKAFRRRGKIKRTAVLSVSIMLLLIGVIMLYGEFLLGTINYQALPTNVATADNDDNKDENDSNPNLLTDADVLNVLLIGDDGGRSDTMILLSIDAKHKKIKLASFLRDTFINIPGYGYSKLNGAYPQGGAALCIKTIEANFGVQIDKYAIINFQTFEKIIDITQGVEIDLSADEADYINFQLYYNNQTSDRYTLEVKDGPQTLNGQQALWYARNRGISAEYDRMWDDVEGHYAAYGGDDWERTARQRNFINCVINGVKGASLTELLEMVTTIGPYVTTNFNKTNIQDLAPHALTFLDYEMEEISVPTSGTWSYGENAYGSIISVDDWEQTCYDLATFIYEDMVVTNTTEEEYQDYEY